MYNNILNIWMCVEESDAIYSINYEAMWPENDVFLLVETEEAFGQPGFFIVDPGLSISRAAVPISDLQFRVSESPAPLSDDMANSIRTLLSHVHVD